MPRVRGSLSVSLAILAAAQLLYNPLGHAQEPAAPPPQPQPQAQVQDRDEPGQPPTVAPPPPYAPPNPYAAPYPYPAPYPYAQPYPPPVYGPVVTLRADNPRARLQVMTQLKWRGRLPRALQRARASGRHVPRRRRVDPGVGGIHHAAPIRTGFDRSAGRVQGEARDRHRPHRRRCHRRRGGRRLCFAGVRYQQRPIWLQQQQHARSAGRRYRLPGDWRGAAGDRHPAVGHQHSVTVR